MVSTTDHIPSGIRHGRKTSKSKNGLYSMSSKALTEPGMDIMESPTAERLLHEFETACGKDQSNPSPSFH
jgi:hypothetical protein